MKEKRQGFVHGAAILAAAGILVKLIGACYKIPLGAILGPVGMANFSLAYNIYALLFVLSTAGVPAAVSKMVSEASARGERAALARIYRSAHFAFAFIGFVGFAVMLIFADSIAAFMGSADAAPAIRAISPSVLFVAISSINRGYYQGLSNMYPTAVSEVIEALGKLIIGLVAALYIKSRGAGAGAVSAGAVLGVSAGAFLSVLYFAFCGREKTDGNLRTSVSHGKILRELFSLAVPITLGASVISLTNVIDSALVMNLLQRESFSEYTAKWLYGAYNYAATVFNLPSALITTLSVSLIPTLASANARRDKVRADKCANTGLSLAMMIAIPAACGIAALSEGILELLYGAGVDSECIRASATMLRCLSLAIAPLALVTVTNGIHQAMGCARVPVYSMLVGAAVKILSNLILVGRAEINILGAAISTVLCYAAIAVLNIVALKKYPFFEISISRVFVKPAVMGFVVFISSRWASGCFKPVLGVSFSTVLSVLVGILSCAAGAFCVGAVGKEDLKMLFGEKSIFKFLNND